MSNLVKLLKESESFFFLKWSEMFVLTYIWITSKSLFLLSWGQLENFSLDIYSVYQFLSLLDCSAGTIKAE